MFAQSHVPEHSELGWIMQCNVAYGELSRMTQFKDKTTKREGQFTSAGLFTYPALQAADILLYDTDDVPVGDDQRQHIEITRDIAIRFNHRFGETFVLPEAVTPAAGARVMSLQDPTSKMSKSDDSDAGCVYLVDEPSVVMKKFKRAVTDSESGPDAVRYDRETKPGVANLLEIHAAVTDRTPQAVADEYEQYGALKVATGEAVLGVLDPIRARYHELMNDRGELARLLRIGSEKAREVASVTLERAHTCDRHGAALAVMTGTSHGPCSSRHRCGDGSDRRCGRRVGELRLEPFDRIVHDRLIDLAGRPRVHRQHVVDGSDIELADEESANLGLGEHDGRRGDRGVVDHRVRERSFHARRRLEHDRDGRILDRARRQGRPAPARRRSARGRTRRAGRPGSRSPTTAGGSGRTARPWGRGAGVARRCRPR